MPLLVYFINLLYLCTVIIKQLYIMNSNVELFIVARIEQSSFSFLNSYENGVAEFSKDFSKVKFYNHAEAVDLRNAILQPLIERYNSHGKTYTEIYIVSESYLRQNKYIL
jgi:hypothetical protein